MECRRNSRIKNSEPLKVEAKMKTLEAKPSNCGSNVRRKNLILKHEILSPECDLFKASTPRRLHFVLIARAIIIVLIGVFGSIYVLKSEFGREDSLGITLMGVIGVLCFTTVIVMLLQTIEGRKPCKVLIFSSFYL